MKHSEILVNVDAVKEAGIKWIEQYAGKITLDNYLGIWGKLSYGDYNIGQIGLIATHVGWLARIEFGVDIGQAGNAAGQHYTKKVNSQDEISAYNELETFWVKTKKEFEKEIRNLLGKYSKDLKVAEEKLKQAELEFSEAEVNFGEASELVSILSELR